jgi:hypothetical protein
MEELKKLIKNTEIEDNFENICSNFRETFPNEKLEDLALIYIRDEDYCLRFTFDLNEKLINCTYDDVINTWVWRYVHNYIISSEECCKVGEFKDENENMPTIWKEANGISYELYPFEQGCELTLPEIGFNKKELTLCGTIDSDNASIGDLLKNRHIAKSLFKTANISYYIRDMEDHENGQIYVIFKDGVEFAGIHTHSYAYQSGDCGTNVYLYKNGNREYIIIENDGDVSSVVVICISEF